MTGGGRGPEAFGFERVAGGAAVPPIPLPQSLGLFAVGAAFAYALSAFNRPRISPPSLGPIKLSASDEGVPIWRAHGVRARVPAVIHWVGEPQEEPVQGRVGKRDVQVATTVYADLAIGLSRHLPGRFSYIERLIADGRTFFDERDPISLETVYESGLGGGDGGVIFNWTEYQDRVLALPTDTRMKRWQVSIESEPQLGAALQVTGLAEVTETIPGTSVTRTVGLRIVFSAAHEIPVGRTRLIRLFSFGTLTDELRQLNIIRWFAATAVSATAVEIPFGRIGSRPLGSWSSLFFAVGGLRNRAGAPRLDGFFGDGETVSVTVNGQPAITLPPTFAGGLTNDRTAFRLDALAGSPNEAYPYRVDATAPRPPKHPTAGAEIVITQNFLGHDRNVVEQGLAAYDFLYAIARAASGDGIEDQEPSPRLVSLIGEDNAPAYRNQVALFLERMNLSSFGSRNVPNIEGVVRCSDTTRGAVLQSICEFHGIATADVDVSQVSGTCLGYAYSGVVAATQPLQELMLAYGLAVQDTGTGLRFLPREACPVIAVPEADWIGGGLGDPRMQFRVDQSGGPARTLTLNFVDDGKDMADGSVVEVDPAQVGGSDESVSLGVSLLEGEARERCAQMLRDANAARFATDGRLPPSYDYLQENDVVTTTIRGVALRLRILTVDIGTDGSVALELIQEPSRPALPEVAPASIGQNSATNAIQGTPRLAAEVWTGLRIRENEDPERGIYVAAAPLGGGIGPSAAVLVSATGGQTWRIAGSVRSSAEVGFVRTVTAPFGWAPAGTWDSSTSFEVEIYQGELESIPEDDAREGRSNLALVGEEVVAFQTATATGRTTALLSGFLRGVGGTPTGTHQARERFVLLGDAVTHVPILESEADVDLLVKVLPVGIALDDVEPITIRMPAIPDRELIAYPGAIQDASLSENSDGSATLRWSRLDPEEIVRYEVRRGAYWLGAPVVWCGCGNETTLRDLAPGTRTYMVRALYRGGLWSESPTYFPALTATQPDNSQQPVTVSDVYTESLGGTVLNLTEDAETGYYGISDGEYSGTYTSAEIDAGSRANWFWLAEIDGHEEDQRPVEDLPQFPIGSTEARAWDSTGREPSRNYPGHDLDRSIADIEAEVGALSVIDLEAAGWTSYGRQGNYGVHTRRTVEARFYDTPGSPSAWTSYAPFTPGRRLASRMQLRVTLERGDLRWQAWLERVDAAARA